MKKFFAVVAVAALSLGAVSCGEKKGESTDNTTDSLTNVVDSTILETADSAKTAIDSTAEAATDSVKAAVEAPATDAPAK